MALTPAEAAFLPMIEAHQAALATLAVPGWHLLARQGVLDAPGLPVFPQAAGSCKACGEDCLAREAQFWAHGRLWRLELCPDCFVGEPVAILASAGPEDGLVDGQAVAGNTIYLEEATRFLAHSDSDAWRTHPVMADLQGALQEGCDLDLFRNALSHALGAVKDADNSSCREGAPNCIQWLPSPVCPACTQPMAFLGQFGRATGFEWGDSGEVYLFACRAHPTHTHGEFQMC
jgi:hypothetical protein